MRIVFSLTTIPSRLNNIYETLESLNDQYVKADAIYLTIPKTCKRLNLKYPKISKKIKDLCQPVYIDQDYGPVTKIIGALTEETDPNTLILTVDDDIIYPPTLISDMLKHHKKYPNSALSSSGLSLGNYPFKYSISFNQKKNDWWFTMSGKNKGREIDILYGYAGALYLRKFFPENKYLYQNFLKYTTYSDDLFKNDDVFLSFYLNKQHIKRRLIDIDEVQNKSGEDALSSDVWNFFKSLNRAVSKCEQMGWAKNKSVVYMSESFGGIVLLGIFMILILSILMVRYFK